MEERAGLKGLTAAGRDAAIGSALTLLGSYFQKTSKSPLESQAALGVGTLEDDVLAAALRFRVALAAARRLENIGEAIFLRPNFRYTTRRTESVGVIRGRLDAVRYAQQFGGVGSPPTYPVLQVDRVTVTPENVLLTASALWTMDQLNRTHRVLDRLLPRTGPETEEFRVTMRRLKKMVTRPLLASCADAARDVLRREQLRSLTLRARQRVNAGHVPNRDSYDQLVTWASECLNGAPGATPGEIDWAFYGSEFDEKLFEVWTLARLVERLDQVAERTDDSVLMSGHPVFSWRVPTGTVEFHFQRSPTSITADLSPRWSRIDTGGSLQGIPDITAVVTPLSGDTFRVYIDPKLRQRPGPPTDELYKILGYFNNFADDSAGQGAIVYYAVEPVTNPPFRYESTTGGRLLAVSVDPERDDYTDKQLTFVVDLILSALGFTTSDRVKPDVNSEEATAYSQQAAVNYLRTFHAAHTAEDRAPWERLAADDIGPLWETLEPEVQVMVVTAVWVGLALKDGFDFSGPVLGLAAAVETLTWNLFIVPALSEFDRRRFRMFGQMLELMSPAPPKDPAKRHAHTAIQARIRSVGDPALIESIRRDLDDLNRNFRRPAAHRTVLGRQAWSDARKLAMTDGALIGQLLDLTRANTPVVDAGEP